MHQALRTTIALLGMVVTSTGCGQSGSGGDKGGDAQGSTTAASEAQSGSEPQVPRRPLYPRCGLEAFGQPTVTAGSSGQGWRLVYQHPRVRQGTIVPGQTTIVNIEQRDPKSRRVSYGAGRRTIRIGGRNNVDVYRKQSVTIAQWVTGRARYVTLADGQKDTVLRNVIRCSR